jgi:hypothetical protein
MGAGISHIPVLVFFPFFLPLTGMSFPCLRQGSGNTTGQTGGGARGMDAQLGM